MYRTLSDPLYGIYRSLGILTVRGYAGKLSGDNKRSDLIYAPDQLRIEVVADQREDGGLYQIQFLISLHVLYVGCVLTFCKCCCHTQHSYHCQNHLFHLFTLSFLYSERCVGPPLP